MFERVGYFLIIVSLFVYFAFFASYQSGSSNFYWLFGGIILMALGIIIVRRNRQPSEKAERFRTVRKMRSRKKKNGEET